MLNYIMLWLIEVSSFLKRLFLQKPTFTFTGEQLKLFFDLHDVEYIQDDKVYVFTEELLIRFLYEVWIDPETEPYRHRIKTRLNHLCENMIVTTRWEDTESLVVKNVYDFIDCAERSFVFQAIDKLSTNKGVIDLLASILTNDCSRQDNTTRYVLIIDKETWEPKHLMALQRANDDPEDVKIPSVLIIEGDGPGKEMME